MTRIRPLNDFPLMERYKQVFPIDIHTIIAYDGVIYCNDSLPDHLIVHEKTHLEQQYKIGLDLWVDRYLTEPMFRLEQEVEAYRNQIMSVRDRNKRTQIRVQCAKILSSALYGSLVSYQQALILLL